MVESLQKSGIVARFPMLLAVLLQCTMAVAQPDLSGVWQRDFAGSNPLVPDPPMTAWGQERFDRAKPIHGPRTTSPTMSSSVWSTSTR